jgi:hypothetical protein
MFNKQNLAQTITNAYKNRMKDNSDNKFKELAKEIGDAIDDFAKSGDVQMGIAAVGIYNFPPPPGGLGPQPLSATSSSYGKLE